MADHEDGQPALLLEMAEEIEQRLLRRDVDAGQGEELRSLAGVLSVKQDTHDIEVSLDRATQIERKVKENALAAQAELEAKAEICNRAYLAEAGSGTIMHAGRLEQMKEVEEHLKARKDLSDGEKHRVAEYLGRKEGGRILNAHKALPESVIASALVSSGTRDFEAATKGMPDYEKDGVRRFIEDEQERGQEKERGLDKGRGRDKGRGLDFSL